MRRLILRHLPVFLAIFLATGTSGCAVVTTTASLATATVGVATTAGSLAVSGVSTAATVGAGAVGAGARAITPGNRSSSADNSVPRGN